MVWVWILGGLALFCFLLGQLRLGLLVTIAEPVTADVRIGLFRFRVLPSKTAVKPKKAKKVKKEKPAATPKDLAEKLKKIPKPDREDLRLALRLFGPALKRALEKTRRGIRIDPLTMSVTIPGKSDPAGAAAQYGYAQGVLWGVLPHLEELLNIPNPQVHIGLDFDRDVLLIRGSVGVSVRLGTLVSLGMSMMTPAIRWLLAFRKRHKAVHQLKTQPSASSDAAA